MTTRERFLKVVHFEQPDYVPYWYAPGIGIAHTETVGRWQAHESTNLVQAGLIVQPAGDVACVQGVKTATGKPSPKLTGDVLADLGSIEVRAVT